MDCEYSRYLIILESLKRHYNQIVHNINDLGNINVLDDTIIDGFFKIKDSMMKQLKSIDLNEKDRNEIKNIEEPIFKNFDSIEKILKKEQVESNKILSSNEILLSKEFV